MHTLALDPPMRSLRSALWNIRTLGFCWWLKLTWQNARASFKRRPPDP